MDRTPPMSPSLTPTAVGSVLSANAAAARMQRLMTVGLLIAGALTSKGGLFGAMHVRGGDLC